MDLLFSILPTGRDMGKSVRKHMKLPVKRTMIILSLGIGAATLPFWGYEMFLLAMHSFNPDYSIIDRCFDQGGKWNYKERICDSTSPTIPDSITECVTAMNRILRPDAKYLMGADIHNDSCIARIWFESHENLNEYKKKRKAKALDIKKEEIAMPNGSKRTVWIEYGVEDILEH